jgi:phage terminase large subunit-like protein
MNLAYLASAVVAAKERAELRPLDFVRWTPPQRAWLADPAPVKLMRGGNQVGKTYAQCAEIIWRCMGTHPFLETHEIPVECWLITHSWEQSIAVCSKLWELLPKDALTPDTVYTSGKGFRGKTPIVRFKNGSLIRVKTTNQGTLGLASATIQYVGIDEPPPPSVFSELSARVLRSSGTIGITLTPVGRPVDWLRDLVEAGTVTDHPAPLTVENCTPEGGRPLVSQKQIDDITGRYLAIDRDARLLGAWECINPERCFDKFDDTHITDKRPPGGRKIEICIGIDHGADAGSEVATLVALDRYGAHPEIWVLDEYTSGSAPPAKHAKGIITMLKRNGLTYKQVDRWTGDRGYGGKRWGGKMSNSRLMRALEQELHFGAGQLPFSIRTAWKPRGSVYSGVSVIHEAMVRGGFNVHPRCVQLIRSLKHHQMKDDHTKHSIDALRYSLELITKGQLYKPHALKMY